MRASRGDAVDAAYAAREEQLESYNGGLYEHRIMLLFHGYAVALR